MMDISRKNDAVTYAVPTNELLIEDIMFTDDHETVKYQIKTIPKVPKC